MKRLLWLTFFEKLRSPVCKVQFSTHMKLFLRLRTPILVPKLSENLHFPRKTQINVNNFDFEWSWTIWWVGCAFPMIQLQISIYSGYFLYLRTPILGQKLSENLHFPKKTQINLNNFDSNRCWTNWWAGYDSLMTLLQISISLGGFPNPRTPILGPKLSEILDFSKNIANKR